MTAIQIASVSLTTNIVSPFFSVQLSKFNMFITVFLFKFVNCFMYQCFKSSVYEIRGQVIRKTITKGHYSVYLTICYTCELTTNISICYKVISWCYWNDHWDYVIQHIKCLVLSCQTHIMLFEYRKKTPKVWFTHTISLPISWWFNRCNSLILSADIFPKTDLFLVNQNKYNLIRKRNQ